MEIKLKWLNIYNVKLDSVNIDSFGLKSRCAISVFKPNQTEPKVKLNLFRATY